jgi:hypothetical protein
VTRHLRTVAYSAAIGLGFAFVPELAARYLGSRFVFDVWTFPGTLAVLAISGWRIDDVDRSLIALVNFVFYSAIAYVIFTVWRKYKRKQLAKAQC